MTQITIVLNENGTLDKVLGDSEACCQLLVRGRDDNKIDESEVLFEEMELNNERGHSQ